MAGPPDTLRVQVLGPVRAWSGDTEIRLGPTRQRVLFAVLALRRDHVVGRDELINAVWGVDAPTTAEGSVYTYVSGLRRAMEPDRSQRAASTPLASEGTGYRLHLAADALDATRFDTLRAEAVAALARDAADDAVGLADRALALWQGEPLTGLPGPFATAARERLVASRLSLLETRASAALRRGRHIELVPELTALVAQNPLHEGVRGLLMIALYRCGRQADALDQFRQARQALAAELDTQPGPRLAEIHQQILANDPALAAPEREPAATPAVRSANRPRTRSGGLVNRRSELTYLRDAMSSLVDGHGLAVWIEGEPGIGKSELLATALAGIDNGRVQVCWGSGDELAQRFPLRVMLECLGVDPDSPDPRRARAAELARRGSVLPDLLGNGGTNTLAVVDGLVDLVRELCADSALALVVDDLQWADEASLLVWNRLARATSRLPLLLVGTCRPVPRTAALGRLRDTVVQQGGATLHLDGLPQPEVDELVRRIVGADPGPGLRRLAGRAAGNPLYVQELTDALVRDQAVRIASGTADTSASTGVAAPASLNSALSHRLGFLSATTIDVLRQATLLGIDFRIDALSVILARRPSELLSALDEATTAGVLVADGDRMAFRHPLVRQALYEGMAHAVRATLHRQAAQRLDDSGAPIDTVARQLAAVTPTVDPWTTGWVLANGELVANRAPDIGLELIRRVLAACDPTDLPRLEALTASLARIRYWLGELPEDEARSVMAMTADPDLAGEMRWILGAVCYRRGREHQAVTTLREAVSATGVSLVWRARCRAMLAAREGIGLGERDVAETTAWTAIREAEQARDVFAKAYALQNLWLMRSIDRDHAEGLRFVDEALRLLDNTWTADPQLAHVHLSLLDNRVFSLQNLDRLAEADDTLVVAEEVVRRHRLPAGLHVSTAVQHYWTGRWDKAVTELSTVVDARGLDMAFHGLRESGPMLLLLHGVAASIAALRDDESGVTEHLAAADELPLLTSADRENSDFLLMAEALAAERAGRPEAALIPLASVLNEGYSPMMLHHQWLPDVMRIALLTNQTDVAARAMEMCETEARREKRAARAAAAAAHCRGLFVGDPEPVLWAAARYEAAGRPLELAQALENAAVLLARAGRGPAARDAFHRGVGQYEALGAAWAIRRATERFRRDDGS